MSFETLLAELDELQLAKALPTDGAADAGEGDNDDAAIADAADEDGEGEGEGADAGEGDGEGEGEPMAKSMRVTTEDGEEIDAIDATEMLKSMHEQIESLGTRFGQTDELVLKALGGLTDLVKSQAAEIGGLKAKVADLAAAGRGRKAVVSVADKPALGDLAKSEAVDEPKGLGRDEFLAKAMDAFDNGKITGLQVSVAEAALNKGQPVPQEIINRVLA